MKSLILIILFIIGFNSIVSLRKFDRNNHNQQLRKLLRQQQKLSSTPISIPKTTTTIKNEQFIVDTINHNHNHQHHMMESFADDDEYFDEIKPIIGHSCEDIRIELCHDVGYNVTSMPNFVGHELQTDAELQLQSFIPLISYGCSSQLKFFLCSVYVPMCTEKVPVMIGPCRPLCENVRSRCAPVLSELGFQWPSALNCSKFVPENTIDHMCMEGPPPHESELITTTNINNNNNNKTPIVKNVLSHNSIISNFNNNNNNNNNHLMMSGNNNNNNRHHSSIHNNNNYGDFPHNDLNINNNHRLSNVKQTNEIIMTTNVIDYQQSTLSSSSSVDQCWQYRRSENYVFLEHPRKRCVAKCETEVLFSEENKNFVDYWTVVWSCLSLISCLFTIITFLWNTNNHFNYPERAIFYISFCSMIYASTFLYRSLIGRQTIACYQEQGIQQQQNDQQQHQQSLLLLVQEGAHNPYCIFSFLMYYYFGMCCLTWWLILTITWSLSEIFNWSQKRLSYYNQYYHIIAWLLPTIQTLSALVLRTIDADELTGICMVGSQNENNLLLFIIIPMTIYLTTGILFTLLSFIYIKFYSNRNNNNNNINNGKCCNNCCYNNHQIIINNNINNNNNNDDENISNSDSSNIDNESTDHQSNLSHTSDISSSLIGCSNFCRRLCDRYNQNHHYHHNNNHFHNHHNNHHHHNHRHHGFGRVGTTSQAGSGHSLLLLPSTKTNYHRNHHHHYHHNHNRRNNHFCSSTVQSSSSTSSYLSSAMSSLNPNVHHHNKNCIINNNNEMINHQQTINNNNDVFDYIIDNNNHDNININNNNLINNNYQNNRNNNNNNDQNNQTSIRSSGIFALFFIIPTICVLSTFIYEYLNKQQWLLRQIDYNNNNNQNLMISNNNNNVVSPIIESNELNRPNFEIFNMRLFMSLVIGIKTGIWILTSRSSPITSLKFLIKRYITKKELPMKLNNYYHHHNHHNHHHFNHHHHNNQQFIRTLSHQQPILKQNNQSFFLLNNEKTNETTFFPNIINSSNNNDNNNNNNNNGSTTMSTTISSKSSSSTQTTTMTTGTTTTTTVSLKQSNGNETAV